jgi:hypothetical protein
VFGVWCLVFCRFACLAFGVWRFKPTEPTKLIEPLKLIEPFKPFEVF